MRRRTRVAVGIVAVWLALVIGHEFASVPPPEPPLPARCADPGAPDAALFLIGDAGKPRAPEPLLDALVADVRSAAAALGADRVAIAFLGDNVYPEGLRPADHARRAEDERRLDAQLDAVRRAGVRGVFVPGNHDWSNGEASGWDAVKRQTRYVAARGAVVLPPDGCPGPATIALGDRLALVALDTQWWQHAYARPSDPASGCAATEPAAAEAAIAAALREAGGRHVIVLAHHPLVSGGPHGARFGWREHLFPLREIDGRLWIPVPVLGSLTPIARMLGLGDQDVTSPLYRELSASLGRAFAAAPPLVYAAGHDHSLQVIRAGPARFQVVSGAGTAANSTTAFAVDGTLYRAVASGFVRLDAFASGAVALEVRALGASGAATRYRACLTD